MLTVYTYRIPKPANAIDFSLLSLETLTESALAVLSHQKTATLWFGYLDGWMLTPQEETLLRKVIRTFHCVVVSRFPLSFSLAWKNEIDCIYTAEQHGDSDSHNDGRAVHDGSPIGHNQSRSQFASNLEHSKN
jgi:hypothetical protein